MDTETARAEGLIHSRLKHTGRMKNAGMEKSVEEVGLALWPRDVKWMRSRDPWKQLLTTAATKIRVRNKEGLK